MYRTTRTILAEHSGLFVVSIGAFIALWTVLLGSHIAASSVGVWWIALCVVSVLNIVGWRLSAVAVARRKATAEPACYAFQQWQLLLSAVFVLGCGFRSILPRADVQRIGLYDSWVSSVMIGRSVATAAELCFVAQWALLLYQIGKDAGCRRAVTISRLLVPLIAVAEVFSWYASLTTCYLGNAIEESIWAVAALLLVIGFFMLRLRCLPGWRPFLAVVIVLGLAYVTFMATVDIPMYAGRWLEDEANGRTYLSLAQGIDDIRSRWHVTFAWEAWQTEIPWMTLYFSVGVWCSIALAHAPRFARKPKFES